MKRTLKGVPRMVRDGAAARCASRRTWLRNFRKNRMLLLFTLPMAAYIFVFAYLPMFGIVIAFKNFNYARGILGSEWVGLKNFRLFFINPDAWRITRNTLGYNAVFIVLNLITNVGVALLLNEVRSRKALKTYQTVMFFPYFLSWVVVAYIAYALLNYRTGIVNGFVKSLGGKPVDWYNTPSAWPVIIVLFNTWKGLGYGSIVYYAAIIGIDTAYYEAASIEGATRWQQTWHITLPELTSLITIMTILAVGHIFSADFGLFYQLTMDSKTLYRTTDVIDTYVFRALMKDGNIGISSASGVFKSLVGFVLVVATNWIVNRINPENALY